MDADTQRLDGIHANRALIEELSAHGMISLAARNAALDYVYPASHWGIWIARLLLLFGGGLLCAGIVFFFAFNWAHIPAFVKFTVLECAILCCVSGAYIAGIARLSGKIAVLAATVLVGALLAVFGQVYQTGADAWHLFLMWGALTLPWVVATDFAGLWCLWLVITNVFLVTFWQQQWPANHHFEMMVISVLAVWNTGFLVLREIAFWRRAEWLQHPWSRLVIVIPVFCMIMIPTTLFINRPGDNDIGMITGALLSVVIHIATYMVYRFLIPDKRVIAAVFISFSLVTDMVLYKILSLFLSSSGFMLSLLMGILTLGVFTLAAIQLRDTYRRMGAAHG